MNGKFYSDLLELFNDAGNLTHEELIRLHEYLTQLGQFFKAQNIKPLAAYYMGIADSIEWRINAAGILNGK